MVFTCCVVNCYNRSGREKGVSFFSIPAVVEHQGDKTKELSMKRRHEWIKRINRKNWTPSKYARVCSDHFLCGKCWPIFSDEVGHLNFFLASQCVSTGKPSMLYDDTNADWIPSLKMGNALTLSTGNGGLEARNNIMKRELEVAEAMLLLSAMGREIPSTAAGIIELFYRYLPFLSRESGT